MPYFGWYHRKILRFKGFYNCKVDVSWRLCIERFELLMKDFSRAEKLLLYCTNLTNTFTNVIQAAPVLRFRLGSLVLHICLEADCVEINDLSEKLLKLTFSPLKTPKCSKNKIYVMNKLFVRIWYLSIIIATKLVQKSSRKHRENVNWPKIIRFKNTQQAISWKISRYSANAQGFSEVFLMTPSNGFHFKIFKKAIQVGKDCHFYGMKKTTCPVCHGQCPRRFCWAPSIGIAYFSILGLMQRGNACIDKSMNIV